MRVIIFAVIVNVIIFIANVVYMNRISKEVYLNLEMFAKFKCLSDEFERYNIKNSKYWVGNNKYEFMAWVENNK